MSANIREEPFVISGIAGRYPDCRNVNELKVNLYNAIDMMSDREVRWSNSVWSELPKRKGVLCDLERFDASFFGIHSKLVNAMDPQCRILLELAYEAILDAGVHPESIRGSRTSVYIAQGLNETFASKSTGDQSASDLETAIKGSASAMLAGRVAYHFDLNGPAITVDTACSGSVSALQLAYNDLRLGICDAALVGACNLLLNPNNSAFFAANQMLSMDGYCRSMDQKASGFARSEGVVMIFLQRETNAKRIYANIVHVGATNDGFKQEGISYPSMERQAKLLDNFYKEIGIDTNSVAYVEAHCTGTIVGDYVECGALDRVFCTGRDEPLLIGTIKSNMGHAESASGLCGITKALLSLESGFVPPNLHFEEPRRDIPSLVSGRLKVCTEITPLSGPLVAVNAFGFVGSNTHCLLRQWHKVKVNGGMPDDTLPRLVGWTGRTSESVSSIFDQLVAMPLDSEFVGLLHETQETAAVGNLCRGFGIFESRGVMKNAICLATEQNYCNEEKRPIVWLFSGMGSQWCRMGESLRHIEIARNAIDECHRILQPYDVDLWSIITSPDPSIFDNILNAFVGITSIQIALVNILRAVNLPVDFFIGHSTGELLCSYADESLSLEETIMCSYWRGKISIDESFIAGRMAAVGLGNADIVNQLPEGVFVACRNSSSSCTLSGPRDKVERFIEELQSKDIFVKLVNTGGIAYHTKYIHHAKNKFLEKFEQTIAVPKLRSKKWLSTSVLSENWHLPTAQFSSPEYHLNNFLNPVLFEETMRDVPANSIVVEIGPCALLQAIIKRELPNAIHIPLMQKSSENNSLNVLKGLGRIFNHGVPLHIKHLYSPVQFPVSRGTPMVAPLIKWEHSDKWAVLEHIKKDISSERKIVVNISDPESSYMKGHIVDDRCLLPAMGYLHVVRETLVQMTPGATLNTTNVHFQNLKWLRATVLKENTPVHLMVNIHRDSGRFEVTENGVGLVSGTVKNVPAPLPLTPLDNHLFSSAPQLNTHDFYKEMRLRGYMYEDEFRTVRTANADSRRGTIGWKNGNWATFMDGMLQIGILSKDLRALQLPTGIRSIKINAADHLNYVDSLRIDGDGTVACDVRMSLELNTIVCGGIEITGLMGKTVSRRQQTGVKVLDRYEFVPLHGDERVYAIDDAIRICCQLISETSQVKNMRIVEMLDRDGSNVSEPIVLHFQQALLKMPLVSGELMLFTQRSVPSLVEIDVQSSEHLPPSGDSTVIVAAKCMTDTEFAEAATKSLTKDGFLLSIEPIEIKWAQLTAPNGFQLLSLVRSESVSLVLMQRHPKEVEINTQNVTIRMQPDDGKYKWLELLQETLASPSAPSVTLVAQGSIPNGALGFVNCLRREKIGHKIQLVQIDDDDDTHPFDEHLALGLPINIRRNGLWGTYRHITIPKNDAHGERDHPMQLGITNISDLSSLVWTSAHIANDRINTHYAALNFRDVMMASGRLPVDSVSLSRREREKILGFEFSGTTKSGNRIMGICNGGALATHINRSDAFIAWNVPDKMTLEEAATIPVVYTTVYCAFFVQNEIKAGKSILIHAGTGGIGLAAIRIAFAYGLRVFTTVSSPEKRKFLLQEFSELNEKHIGNSRDCSFEKMIMDETNGAGVDYVLNSLSEEKLIASVRCLSRGGIFMEIGKFDIFNSSNLDMRLFARCITFRAIFCDQLHQMPDALGIIRDRIEVDLACGIIRPLPTTVFASCDAEKAFRYLGGAKHIGKVLLQMRKSDGEPLPLSFNILPKIVCNPELVYVLVGGLGGFGLELADWLVIRGAQNIVLNSRCGAKNAYQLYRIRVWKSYGCKVCITSDDTTTRSGCKKLLKTASEYGDVGGIFNVAVVLRDCIIENQTPKSFEECLAPKSLSTQHLDELSRQMCPSLEHFVVFSSVACGLGNAGQTNYGMANAIMERIVERRVRDGLPGKAIQWGVIGDVGIVAEMLSGKTGIEMLGTAPQRIDSCLGVMDELLCCNAAIVTSMFVSQKRTTKKLDLIGSVLNIIGITDIKSVSILATLTELGVDSLMKSEIKQMLEQDYNIQMDAEDIRMLTLAKLSEMASTGGEVRPTISEVARHELMFATDMFRHMGNEGAKNVNIIAGNVAAHTADDSAPCVLVIPGITGVASDALLSFCQRLKMAAFILQLHSTHQMDNLEEVVGHLAVDILDLHKNRRSFCIAAYSFGTVLAVEVARLLEQKLGRRGRIYMIDANTYAIHKYLDKLYGCDRNCTEERSRMKILREFVSRLPKDQSQSGESRISTAETSSEMVDACSTILQTGKYSREYIKEGIVGFINRCVIVEKARWKEVAEKVESNITLIQATESFIDHNVDGIAAHTNGKISKVNLKANHTSILTHADTIQTFVGLDNLGN